MLTINITSEAILKVIIAVALVRLAWFLFDKVLMPRIARPLTKWALLHMTGKERLDWYVNHMEDGRAMKWYREVKTELQKLGEW